MTKSKGLRRRFSTEEEQYIRDNILDKTAAEMSLVLNRTSAAIYSYMHRNGIIIPDEVKSIRKEQTTLNLTEGGKRHRFPKGHVPQNKGKKMTSEQYEKVKHTFFQKGHLPKNTKFDGYESIRMNRYGALRVFVRVSKRVHIEKQILLWEEKYGPVPEGKILYCKNGDALNTDPSNWELVTRAESIRRCRLHRNSIAKYLSGGSKRKNDSLKNAILKDHDDLISLKRALMLGNESLTTRIKNNKEA